MSRPTAMPADVVGVAVGSNGHDEAQGRLWQDFGRISRDVLGRDGVVTLDSFGKVARVFVRHAREKCFEKGDVAEVLQTFAGGRGLCVETDPDSVKEVQTILTDSFLDVGWDGKSSDDADLTTEWPDEFPDPDKKTEILPPLPYISMANWDNEPPPAQEWAIVNRVPLRQVALFSGEGAAGKSTVQLHLSAAHVLGRDWLGVMPEPGPAIFIDAEDDAGVLHRRLAAICNHYQVTFAELVKGGLHLMSLAGEDAILGAPNRSGRIESTQLYKRLLQASGDIRPKMIGIASSANVYAGNELDRSQVQQFIGLLTKVAIVAGGSVVLISHPSVAGMSNGTGLSGSTQWHNAVRARFYMKSVTPKDGEQPDTDLREIEFKKNQYGKRAETIVLRYRDGMFLPERGMSSLDKLRADTEAEYAFLKCLDDFAGQGRRVSPNPGPTYAPVEFAKSAAGRAIGKRGLEDAMRRLFEAKKIVIRPNPDMRPSKARAVILPVQQEGVS